MTVGSTAWMCPPHRPVATRRQRVRALRDVLGNLRLAIGQVPNLGPRVSTAAVHSTERTAAQHSTHLHPTASSCCAAAISRDARSRPFVARVRGGQEETSCVVAHSSLRANPRRMLRGSVPLLGSGANCGNPRLSSREVISREPFFISAIWSSVQPAGSS
jgi:hypothetical protein